MCHLLGTLSSDAAAFVRAPCETKAGAANFVESPVGPGWSWDIVRELKSGVWLVFRSTPGASARAQMKGSLIVWDVTPTTSLALQPRFVENNV